MLLQLWRVEVWLGQHTIVAGMIENIAAVCVYSMCAAGQSIVHIVISIVVTISGRYGALPYRAYDRAIFCANTLATTPLPYRGAPSPPLLSVVNLYGGVKTAGKWSGKWFLY